MKHIQILFLILNLIVGITIILYSYELYKKHKDRYVLNLMYYSIAFNLLVFVDLNYKYFMANIFDNNFSTIPIMFILPFIILIIIAEYFFTYYIYLTIISLYNKTISRKANYLFIAWISFFSSASILGMYIFYSQSDQRWFYVIHEAWIMSMIIIILLTLILHLISSNKIIEPDARKLKLSFIYIFLFGYTGFSLSQINFYFFHTDIETYDSLILLFINFCPYLWIRLFYIKYRQGSESKNINLILIDKLAKEFNLTSREKDVVELIMKGKTNNEIESALFISFNTVKNHIYNVFKKMGVNSRSQLLYFINNYEK